METSESKAYELLERAAYNLCEGCRRFGPGSVNGHGEHVDPARKIGDLPIRCMMPPLLNSALWGLERARRAAKETVRCQQPSSDRSWETCNAPATCVGSNGEPACNEHAGFRWLGR